jgi:2-polyprenyl-3-methyl-5-hydroxy-6-metoxy-1,4-benzoquinol methylase
MIDNNAICFNCKSELYSHFLYENGYELVRCEECGILYVLNPPGEQEVAEATRAGKHKGARELNVNVRYRNTADYYYRSILPKIFCGGESVTGTWLDVGCGYGEFMETVQDCFGDEISVYGLEPNEVKRHSAQTRGLNVSDFKLFGHADTYDVVSLMNVYSHLYRPNKFLAEMAGVVRKGGLVLIQTGDVTNVTRETFLKPAGLPDHLSFVTEEVLVRMLADAGMKVERVVKVPSLIYTLDQVVKEFIKLFVPGKSSFLKYYLSPKNKRMQSMFVLARKL